MANFYTTLIGLLPGRPLQIGTVTSIAGGVATIALPGGGADQARGETTVGARVFFRDGAIEGSAPTLPIELVDV